MLFHSQDRFIGALRLSVKAALENARVIWTLTKEDFTLTTEDAGSGLCLEKNHYDESEIYVPAGIYELTTWGVFILE